MYPQNFKREVKKNLRTRKVFEEIMPENFPKLTNLLKMNSIKPQLDDTK